MLALRDQIAPPTLNLENPDAAADGLDLIGGQARAMKMQHAVSNGFGFGSVNANVIFAVPFEGGAANLSGIDRLSFGTRRGAEYFAAGSEYFLAQGAIADGTRNDDRADQRRKHLDSFAPSLTRRPRKSRRELVNHSLRPIGKRPSDLRSLTCRFDAERGHWTAECRFGDVVARKILHYIVLDGFCLARLIRLRLQPLHEHIVNGLYRFCYERILGFEMPVEAAVREPGRLHEIGDTRPLDAALS